MRPLELYMAFRLKLMFSLFAGNPKQNSKPKYHLTKGRINEFVHQFRCNILQMKNIDFHNLPLFLQGCRIDLDIQYLRCLLCMKLFFPTCCLVSWAVNKNFCRHRYLLWILFSWLFPVFRDFLNIPQDSKEHTIDFRNLRFAVPYLLGVQKL